MNVRSRFAMLLAGALALPAFATDPGCAPVTGFTWNPVICPGDTININGVDYSFWGFQCPTGATCSFQITVNERGEVTSVTGWCTNCP